MLASYVGQNAMFDLRVGLFKHLEGLSLSFFDRNPVGRLTLRLPIPDSGEKPVRG